MRSVALVATGGWAEAEVSYPLLENQPLRWMGILRMQGNVDGKTESAKMPVWETLNLARFSASIRIFSPNTRGEGHFQ